MAIGKYTKFKPILPSRTKIAWELSTLCEVCQAYAVDTVLVFYETLPPRIHFLCHFCYRAKRAEHKLPPVIRTREFV